MSYAGIAQAAADPSLRARIAACIAQEGAAGMTYDTSATALAERMVWQVCSEPGWGEAWESALASRNPAPGLDPAVISDSMILAAVQKHLAAP